jgi:hypothetical protein
MFMVGNQCRKYSPEFKDEAVKLVIIALLEARSMTNAKAADKVRMEGKVHLTADGDMMIEFRSNMHHGEFAHALVSIAPPSPHRVRKNFSRMGSDSL